MCTVTWIHSPDKIIVTSNRDEHQSRPTAQFPHILEEQHGRLLFPKDGLAGGTWFAVSELGRMAVLLNGAFENHERKTYYRLSRGKILLDILRHENPLQAFTDTDLIEIEPFTLIYSDGISLYELRWDATEKHQNSLYPHQPYIWSSSTLYNSDVREQRRLLFQKFLIERKTPHEEDLLSFHQFNHGDFENGFVIDRLSGLKTVSITQAALTSDNITMRYLDMENHVTSQASLDIKSKIEEEN